MYIASYFQPRPGMQNMPYTALTATAAFRALCSHHTDVRERHMRDLFAADARRFDRMNTKAAGILLDYSKNRIDDTTLKLLFELARERGVETQRAAMFRGDKINFTEHRAVLHTALRAPRGQGLLVDGQNIDANVHAVLERMHAFVERVRDGQWLGRSGRPITDIVNIGIGGSHLGPQMACTALRAFSHPRLKMHFVSNVDGHDLDAVLQRIDADTTLFIVASKTFTTQETMINARSARGWFLTRADEADLARHFIAVSTSTAAVRAFGIDPDNMFPFWDWVGGRYSMWSSIGLSIALAVGFRHFLELLAGAHAMDQHFCAAPLERDMPAILALIGIWNRNFFNSAALSIAAYHHDLRHFSAYL